MSGFVNLGGPGPRRRALLARRESTCPACGEDIHEGTEIEMVDGEAIHADCED